VHHEGIFLAFDPSVSRHYEVFLLPKGRTQPYIKKLKKVDDTEPLTWLEYLGHFDESPPSDEMAEESLVPSDQGEVSALEKQQEIHVDVSNYVEPKDTVIRVSVFSSQTGQWTRRKFVPGRCAPRHLYDLVNAPHPGGLKIWKTAEYWQGSLYVHCWNNIIMILRNSKGTYDMAQLPQKADDDREYGQLPKRSVVASYDRGVYYVALDKFQLHIWTLIESDDGQVGWMLAHQADLSPHNPKIQRRIEPRVLWEAVKNSEAIVSLFEPHNLVRLLCLFY
jgi:hypothetical protein